MDKTTFLQYHVTARDAIFRTKARASCLFPTLGSYLFST